MDWLAANYGLLKQLWVVWFLVLFAGIVIWAFRPGNKARLEAQGRIPLDDDLDIARHVTRDDGRRARRDHGEAR